MGAKGKSGGNCVTSLGHISGPWAFLVSLPEPGVGLREVEVFSLAGERAEASGGSALGDRERNWEAWGKGSGREGRGTTP